MIEQRVVTTADFLVSVADDVTLNNIKLVDANISGERVYDVVLNGCTFVNVNWGYGDWDGLKAHQCTFKDCRFEGVGFDAAVFTECLFFDSESSVGCHFYKSRLRQTVFRQCNVSMCDFDEAQLVQVTFDGCQGMGSKFFGAMFKGRAVLTKNMWQYADFRGGALAAADLSHSDLKWAHLDEADLSGANLMGCDLNGVTSHLTNFTGADLRGAELISIDPRTVNLTGVKIFEAQVRQLVENMEIVIFPDGR